MTDTRVDEPGDEDRLPWLEAVEDDEDGDGPSAAKLLAAVVIGLVAIGLIVGGLFWLGNRGADAEEQLIAAPEGDYKVAPDSPGGMPVEGEGDVSHAASAGADPQGNINIDAVPEAPVTQQPPQAQPQPAPGQQQAAAQPQPPAAQQQPAQQQPAQPAGPGGSIQLGAFSSQAAANTAWRALSGRFTYLAPLSHSVTPVESGGRTLYRLRASGPDAAALCRRLQVAGESCVVVG
ncbi:MAG: SPOR domain-containing protein [Allosphingosinicella sp.]|uniref:SPOR domain-containing protein n=1 Tax=Allosphingosinicella sp. TaxID=2823234 RepID=UPI00393ED06A